MVLRLLLRDCINEKQQPCWCRDMKTIPYAKHTIGKAEIKAVKVIMLGNNLTQGNTVARFEEVLCKYIGCEHAIAVSSGTAALHIAMQAAKIKYNLKTIATTALTFVAVANAIEAAGIKIITRDIHPTTYLMQNNNQAENIIDMHYAGFPNTIITKSILMEDAAHSFGASRLLEEWEKVGCNKQYKALLTCFSFHPSKTITTGEGGCICTNDGDIDFLCRCLRDNGRATIGKALVRGSNYRMTDIAAAIGIEQIKKTDEFIARRRWVARQYYMHLEKINDIQLPSYNNPEKERSAWHLFVIKSNIGNGLRILFELQNKGIMARTHYMPLWLHPRYDNLQVQPITNTIWQDLITLPIYPTIKKEQIRFVCRQLIDILNNIKGGNK